MKDWQKLTIALVGACQEDLIQTQESIGGVSISRTPLGNGLVSLEVDSGPDTTSFAVSVNSSEADRAMEFIENELIGIGVKVFKNYEDFERAFLELE